MADNVVAICNQALLQVGHTDFIADLDEDTEAARISKVAYPLSLSSVLSAFPWPFATRRATLALLGANLRDGWGYLYSLPAKCAHPGYLWAGIRNPRPEERIPFTIEDGGADATGQVLLTDLAPAVLVYTSSAVDESLFPAAFVDALSWHLSVKLALGLAKKPELARLAGQEYMAKLGEAKAAELRKRQADPRPDSEIVRARE